LVNFIKNVKHKEIYLLAFLIVAIGLYVFKDFLLFNKLYVYNDVGSDTFDSYWPYYVQLNELLKNGLPLWSFKLGIGTSIFSVNMLIFDPFNIFFLFTAKENLVYILPYIALLKILLAGLFFYLYVSSFNISKYSALISSLLYAFNGYMILWGQHYFFATIIVFAPLLLYAFELWLKKSKWIYFTLMITLFAVFSYYFLYMITIFLAIYGAFRLLIENSFNFKKFIVFAFKSIGIYLLGIGLSAIILFPAIYVALTSTRVNAGLSGFPIFKLASLVEYITMFGRAFSNDMLGTNYEYVGYSNYFEGPELYIGLLSLLLIPQLFCVKNKKDKIIYGIFISIFVSFLVFPYFSVMMNAFSASTYRWTFVIILFGLFLVSQALNLIDKNTKINTRLLIETFITLIFLIFFILIYKTLRVAHLENSGFINVYNLEPIFLNLFRGVLNIIILLSVYTLLLYLFNFNKYKTIVKLILLLVVCFELTQFSYKTINDRRVLDNTYITQKQGYYDYSNEAISYIKNIDKDFYRIDKNFYSRFLNDQLFQGYNGLKSYNSVNNPEYVKFLLGFDVPLTTTVCIPGVDSRLDLQTLLGVRYYLSNSTDNVPYGYQYLKTIGNINIFKNNYYLPLGFMYDSFLTNKEFSSMNKEEKDNTILKGFILDEKERPINDMNLLTKDNINNNDYSFIQTSLSQVSVVNLNIISNNLPQYYEYKALNNNPQIILPISNPKVFENLLISMDIISENSSTGQVFWKDSNEIFNERKSSNFSIKPGENHYEIILGSVKAESIRLDIGDLPGKYIVKNLQIKSKNMNAYKSNIMKLKENILNVNQYSDNFIKGQINTDKDGLLFLAIPYDKGWIMKVDDKKVDIQRVNLGFVGTYLKKGFHEISLYYEPPYYKIGIVISGLSLVVILLLYLKKRVLI